MIRRVFILSAVCLASIVGVSAAAAQVDGPLVTSRYRGSLQFRTLTIGNFDIYFHRGEERLAQRLAGIVQEVAPAVDRRLGAPRGRVRVILVDQTDVSNGWATIVPYNLIEIAAVPPPGASEIGNTDDWLRLVFTHEYTHVVHLEKSRGWLGSLRRVFGRVPAFYSNLFLPSWQIEGLATFEESALTQQGRVKAGDFRMMLEHAKAAGRFAPLDRATTAVIDWPGGTSAYLYGAYFHQFLAERWGEESLGRLAEETAERLPFFGSRAFKEVYGGRSLGSLWKEFEMSIDPGPFARGAADLPRARLTDHGFTTTSPYFSRDGRLFYSIVNPHGFPSLMELTAAGPRRLTTRYFGRQLSGAGELLVFDQLEVEGHVGLLSDLYAHDLRSGDTRRLTHGARAADPDLSSDGRIIVCTIQESGRRVLATLASRNDGTFMPPTPLASEESTEFSTPRWSPDGRLVVAERRRLGRPSELVVIEVASGSVRRIFAPARGRVVTPSWTPDGSRILFSWDVAGNPFRVHSISPDGTELRWLVGAGDGAEAATVSPDGQRIVFVAYTADGYDLFSIDASNAEWAEMTTGDSAETTREMSTPVAAVESRPYSPAETLAPTFFTPYFERDGDDTVLGAATVGFDALGRHTYLLSLGWGVVHNHLDVHAEYTYARWRPALFYGLSGETNSRGNGFIRSRDVAAGALLPFRQVRWASDVLASVSYSKDDLLDADDRREATRERYAGRAGVRVSNARGFGYSISPEEGAALSIVSEVAREGGGDDTARTIVAEARAYLRAVPRHGVLAGRAAYATSRGTARVRREFSAGGSGPQGGGFDVGFDAIGLLRGFDAADLFGRSALSLNADYRVPLGWPQRGFGTLPVFLQSVHGALFVDAAHAWDTAFRRQDLRRSAGAELSFDIVLGGALPATVTTGVAFRHDPTRVTAGAAAFFRIGRAF